MFLSYNEWLQTFCYVNLQQYFFDKVKRKYLNIYLYVQNY